MSDLKVLCVGVEPLSQKTLRENLKNVEITEISSQEHFEKSFDSWADGQFAAVFTGGDLPGLPSSEVAQVVNSQCPETPKYFITTKAEQFEPRVLIKNGMNGAFILPSDIGPLKRVIGEKILSRRADFKDFRSVKVLDIDPETKLEYDVFVYLPLNGKRIRFAGKDQSMGTERQARLTDKHLNSVLIESRDLPSFYRQSADRLRALGGVSSTENAEKLNEAVRTLIVEIFDQSSLGDFTESRKFVETCQGIISNYVTKGASSDWYQKLMASVGDTGDVYNHAANVSTYCALFAMACGYQHPEELAIAGLFHDVGMSLLPVELMEMDPAQMNPDQKAKYQSHVEQGIDLLKRKKIIISAAVEKAILQHHERFDGVGFPKGLPGARLSEEAQILSFSDQFDDLTAVRPGHRRLTPEEAYEAIKMNGSVGPEVLAKIGRSLVQKGKGAA